MKDKLITDKLQEQAQRIIFIAAFQSLTEALKAIEEGDKTKEEKLIEKTLLDGFLEAAILDATSNGLIAEA